MADTKNPAYKHGHSGRGGFSPEYHSWASMIQRCTNPNRDFWKDYGGRGIKVCDRWRGSFEDFLADMGPRPAGTTLDRIDVDGDYSLENCRWATTREQATNSRRTTKVEIDGEIKPLVTWCSDLDISINTVRDRVKFYGMSYSEALTTPKQSIPFRKLREVT